MDEIPPDEIPSLPPASPIGYDIEPIVVDPSTGDYFNLEDPFIVIVNFDPERSPINALGFLLS